MLPGSGNWFDSPWYPILYKNRNESEAVNFINRLLGAIPLKSGDRVLDVACGNGRHSRALASHGFLVTGIDNAATRISEALAESKGNPEYLVHDMRLSIPGDPWSAAFNLFTSFGYFTDEKDNETVLKNVRRALVAGGYFVLDYINPEPAIRNLVPEEYKNSRGIDFGIKRFVKSGFIIKEITVDNGNELRIFEERVRAYSFIELSSLIRSSGFEILENWGDYGGGKFAEDDSSRMIFIARAL